MDSEPNDQQTKQEHLRTRWTPALDKIFADVVVEQIEKGNRPNAVFDKKAWNQIRDEFNRQTNLDFNNNQLRKHLDVLRTRYHSLQLDYNQNDTIQDPSYMRFDMWEDISAQSKLDPARTNDCLIYQQFRTIFADTSLDGKYAQSSHYQELDKSNPLFAGVVLASPVTPTSERNVSSPKDTSERKRKRPFEASSVTEKSGWNQELSDAMARAILDMINCSKLREVAKPVIDERFSISNCIKALDQIEGIDNHLYYAALELFETLTFRETFILLSSNYARLMWLQEKCAIYTSSMS